MPGWYCHLYCSLTVPSTHEVTWNGMWFWKSWLPYLKPLLPRPPQISMDFFFLSCIEMDCWGARGQGGMQGHPHQKLFTGRQHSQTPQDTTGSGPEMGAVGGHFPSVYPDARIPSSFSLAHPGIPLDLGCPTHTQCFQIALKERRKSKQHGKKPHNIIHAVVSDVISSALWLV